MRWTDHPCFMGDVWNIHDLWLMYSTYTSNGRCMKCSCFTVDVQGTPAPQKMVRTPKTDKAQTTMTYVRLELIFLLLLLEPSSRLRKTLIPILRIRILGFHHYGNTSNTLESLWQSLLLAEVTPKRLGTLQP